MPDLKIAPPMWANDKRKSLLTKDWKEKVMPPTLNDLPVDSRLHRFRDTSQFNAELSEKSHDEIIKGKNPNKHVVITTDGEVHAKVNTAAADVPIEASTDAAYRKAGQIVDTIRFLSYLAQSTTIKPIAKLISCLYNVSGSPTVFSRLLPYILNPPFFNFWPKVYPCDRIIWAPYFTIVVNEPSDISFHVLFSHLPHNFFEVHICGAHRPCDLGPHISSLNMLYHSCPCPSQFFRFHLWHQPALFQNLVGRSFHA